MVGRGGQETSEKKMVLRDSLLYPRTLIHVISFNPENDLIEYYLHLQMRKPETINLNNSSAVVSGVVLGLEP